MSVRFVRTILVLLAIVHNSRALVDEVVDVLKLGKEIGEEIIASWNVVGKTLNVSEGVELPLIRRRERLILAKLSHISQSIDRLELGIEKAGAVALFLAKNGGRGTRFELKLHDMTVLLNKVAAVDRQMRVYVGLQEELERSTLLGFAQSCVFYEPDALPGVLEQIHAHIVPPHKLLLGKGLLQQIVEEVQEGGTDVCTLQMSPHQLIYDIYNTIALAEIKGYAIMQFSWMLLKLYGKGNFSQEASLTRERYGQRTTQAANVVRGVLSSASRDLYRCDPIQHEEGKTYDQVTRLLQGYIENEVDMNPQGTCQENCGYYTLTQRYGCYDDQLCTQQKTCGGRIINCQYIDSDMWVCPSGDSKRRYDWVTYENGRTLGQKGECTSGGHSTKVDSWWKWNLFHCSYCFCLCEDAVDISERFFSMREALAQISKNKVVTGLRLIKHGRVFHLQVYESTLKERGLIEGGDWVPVQKFDPLDPQFKDGVDYHTLTYENRAIDLDDLDSPSGHVLTGVRFRMLGAHLHFEIRSTPFNYTTGRLSPEKSQWISNDNTEGSARPRVKLELKNPDIPTRSSVPLAVDSEHDQYVEFTNSDLEADAAQSTVPFIDVQPVLPAGAGALASGAGVLHRGARGSGGFVALRLRTYPHARHVRAEPPADLPRGPDPADGPDFEPTVN
ncbi:uncharacterized protein LOC101735738 isoform X1 [Bombyx mori]|uniref:Uncharacterized protein n=1 Tax=Bombyx mori TaxID=7091 RepID=A0A8R2G8Y8_BOMMO|nr:uncharacterized protein LOC101735738 isoform X1 [Bombyx mori]